MKRINWSVVFRLLWTAAILVIVWRNSHWSVALTLTGLCLSNELNQQLIHELRLLGTELTRHVLALTGQEWL